MNEVTLPPDTVFQHALAAFFASTTHSGTRARGASLIERGCSAALIRKCALVKPSRNIHRCE
jgi:hypothetical protein